MRVKKMSVRAIRIKLQGSFVLIFGGGPIPVVPENDKTELGMGISEIVVKFNCLLRRLPCLRKNFSCGHVTGERRTVCIRKSDVGKRVRRVDCNRLLEV